MSTTVNNAPLNNYTVAAEVISSQQYQFMKLIDATASSTTPIGTAANPLKVTGFNSLVTAAYDYISLSYTGSNVTTVVYKTGGSGGTTVATLTLAYSGSNITSVTKT